MAEIRFVRLGGNVSTGSIDTVMTVGEFLKKNEMNVSTGDDIRVGGKSVTLETKINPDQATLITAVPKIKGGN
jgi:hypothetical protein